MEKFIIVVALSISQLSAAGQTFISNKGSKIVIDTSKWTMVGTDVYTKAAARVGIGTKGIPDSNAALEVRAMDKGILIPRVALLAKNNPAPLFSHVTGMLVYNTATAGAAPDAVTPGFYYNTGNGWKRSLTESAADAFFWKLGGNPLTDTNTNFLGTTDDRGVAIKTNNFHRVMITHAGNVGMGTTTPEWLLELYGTDAVGKIKRLGATASQAPAVLLVRAKGSRNAESNIAAGDQLGKIQFKGRLSGADADYASLLYTADGTQPGNGHFGFTTSNSLTEVMSIRTDSMRVGIAVDSAYKIHSTLQVAGSMAANILFITGDITLNDTHHYLVLGNSGTGSPYKVTLPQPGTCKGRAYHFRVESNNSSTSISYKTLSGNSTTSLPNNASITLVSTGNQWLQF